MALTAPVQMLVPDFDVNRIVTGYTLRTVRYDDKDTQNIQGLPRPKALVIPAPWQLPSFTIVSTP